MISYRNHEIRKDGHGWWIEGDPAEGHYATLYDCEQQIDLIIANEEEKRETAEIEAELRAQKRIADRVDGYDRDDLGESPDF